MWFGSLMDLPDDSFVVNEQHIQGMSVFFIHIATSLEEPKSNNMPASAAIFSRNIKPCCRWAPSTAISTVKTWGPDAV